MCKGLAPSYGSSGLAAASTVALAAVPVIAMVDATEFSGDGNFARAVVTP
jgi:hypothetical protein